jgi:hypothetical protein
VEATLGQMRLPQTQDNPQPNVTVRPHMFHMFALLTVHYTLSLTENCVAGRGSTQGDGKDLRHLVALRDEDAPLETMERWHLMMREGVPEAGKFYAHKGRAAQKVCVSESNRVTELAIDTVQYCL